MKGSAGSMNGEFSMNEVHAMEDSYCKRISRKPSQLTRGAAAISAGRERKNLLHIAGRIFVIVPEQGAAPLTPMCEKANAADKQANESFATSKDKHDFLVSLLKETRYGMVDFGFKSSTVLTLFIGWIVSSDTAREFVITTPGLRPILVGTIAAYWVLFLYWTWSYRKRSCSAYSHLETLGFLPKEYYSTLVVTKLLVATFAVTHGMMCGTLIYLITKAVKTACA
jgi:hypothetical protein